MVIAMQNIDPQKLADMLKAHNLGGGDGNDLEKAVQSGDLSAFLSKLSPAQSARLQAVLSDKAATERLLSTPQAKALLQRLIGNK